MSKITNGGLAQDALRWNTH